MQTAPPTTFLLVRHAETMWNKEKRHTGTCEVELSDAAPRQITKLTRLLTQLEPTVLYSSPLSRCRITIAPLAEVLDLKIQDDIRLIERNLGAWEGKHAQDLLPDHPGYEFPQSAYTGEFRIPDAEPLEDLEKRLRELLGELSEKHEGETLALSTHSGVIWAILHRIVTNPPEKFFWPGNCSITKVTKEGNHYHYVSFEQL